MEVIERKGNDIKTIIVEDVLKQGDRKKDHNIKLWLTPQEVKEILNAD